MNRWFLAVMACCGLVSFSAPGHATFATGGGNIDYECYDQCLKEEQADQCSLGSIRLCVARCTRVPETRALFNGIEYFGGMTKTPDGIEYYASALNNACGACEVELGNDTSGLNSCAVMPASTNNLCTELDPDFAPTSMVGLVSNTVFEESRELGKILWNIDAIFPCSPVFDYGNTVLTQGQIYCDRGTQVGGMGCYEYPRNFGSTSLFCPTTKPENINCNRTTVPRCKSTSSIDACADGNVVGVY